MSRLGRFDKTVAHDVVTYSRYSSKGQNRRSINQQQREIREAIRRHGLTWSIVKEYSDEAKSGKTSRKRPGFQQMRSDLFSGRVRASVILVDEIRRFARSEDCDALRRSFKRRGILLLCADKGFVDPTSTTGAIVSAVDDAQGEAENAAKADMVRRGQRDRVLQGHWANGEAPFGLKRQWVTKVESGVEVHDYTILICDPERAPITRELFRIAVSTGRAGTYVYDQLRDDDRFPANIRAELNPDRIDYMLQNTLYTALYVWGKTQSVTENEQTIHYPVAADEHVQSKLSLEPLCSDEEFEIIRQGYARRAKKPRRDSPDGPTTAFPVSQGVTLINPLAGLVRCGSCGRAMGLSRGGKYITKSGDERCYEKLKCPRAKSGRRCENERSVPRDWLIDEVFRLVRDRLFLKDIEVSPGTPTEDVAKLIQRQPAFTEFVHAVRRELERLEEFRPNRADAIREQLKSAKDESDGVFQSIKSPAVRGAARTQLELHFTELSDEIERLTADLHEAECATEKLADAADEMSIARRLAELGRFLSGKNAGLINTLLAQHIVRINCTARGSVRVLLTKLGCLTLEAHDRDWMLHALAGDGEGETTQRPATGRRLTRRDLSDAVDDDQLADSLNEFATDIERFDGLGANWIEEVVFSLPVPKSWPEEHAVAVAEYRLAHGVSMVRTASHFGVSVPTIRAALRIARDEHGIDALGKEVSRDNIRCWARENADAVLEFIESTNARLKDAEKHFGKSQPTISKALKYARAARKRSDEEDGGLPASKAA